MSATSATGRAGSAVVVARVGSPPGRGVRLARWLSWTSLSVLWLCLSAAPARAQTTIHPSNALAWSANGGWIQCRGEGDHGARVGEYVCSGYVYAANLGWIHLGDGSPANGIRYRNADPADYGVNRDPLGALTGLAYGANLGWLVFTNRDAQGGAFEGPSIDLRTGRFRGWVYSANTGWISLSNAVAMVQTTSVLPGPDTDADGLADAWELTYAADLGVLNAVSDLDGDGASDRDEYRADTDPRNALDQLRLTAWTISAPGTNVVLTWSSKPTRDYFIQERSGLGVSAGWRDSGLGSVVPDPGSVTTRGLAGSATAEQVYRVESRRPLSP